MFGIWKLYSLCKTSFFAYLDSFLGLYGCFVWLPVSFISSSYHIIDLHFFPFFLLKVDFLASGPLPSQCIPFLIKKLYNGTGWVPVNAAHFQTTTFTPSLNLIETVEGFAKKFSCSIPAKDAHWSKPCEIYTYIWLYKKIKRCCPNPFYSSKFSVVCDEQATKPSITSDPLNHCTDVWTGLFLLTRSASTSGGPAVNISVIHLLFWGIYWSPFPTEKHLSCLVSERRHDERIYTSFSWKVVKSGIRQT